MASNGYDIGKRMVYLANRVFDGAGDNPVIFLDTGAVIDFEREIKGWKLKEPSANPSEFYQFFKRAVKSPMFVTSGAFGEIINHNKFYTIGGRPEVSDETLGIIEGMNRAYERDLREVSSVGRDIGQIEYDVYWASKMAFDENHKKSCKDPISDADREQLASAIWARYSCAVNNAGEQVPVTSAIIISPDCHFSGTIGVLESGLGYNGVRAVSNR